MTDAPICGHCGRPVRVSRDRYDELGQRHRLCAHMAGGWSAEHANLDHSEPCGLPGCSVAPVAATTPRDAAAWIDAARRSAFYGAWEMNRYAEPYPYDMDNSIVGHQCFQDAEQLLRLTAAYLDAASRDSAQLLEQEDRELYRLLHSRYDYEGPTEPKATTAYTAWNAARRSAVTDEEVFDQTFARVAAAITGPPPREGEDRVPLPVRPLGILATIEHARAAVAELAAAARTARRTNAVAMYARADRALCKTLMYLVLAAESQSKHEAVVARAKRATKTPRSPPAMPSVEMGEFL